MKVRGHTINGGTAEGEAIVYHGPFSFVGDLDPDTGVVPVKGHDLEGQKLANKIFVFTTGKGSSLGPYWSFWTKRAGNAPRAMVCIKAEPIIALAAITADIPMVDGLEKNPLDIIKTGDYVKVNATQGIVEVTKAQR